MADADTYKIKIKDLALFVRNVQLSPAVRMGHVKALEVKVDTVPRFNKRGNLFLAFTALNTSLVRG
jgi:hypothetical protein